MNYSRLEDVDAAAIAIASADPVGFLGPLLLSALAGVFFSGVLTTQGATYFRCFPNDNGWLKLLVGGILVASALQTAFLVVSSWRWFVVGYGDWAALVTVSWVVACKPILSQFTVSLAQSFFVYRSFILTQRNRLLLGFLVCGITASLWLFIAFSVDLLFHPHNVLLHELLLFLAWSLQLSWIWLLLA